MKTKDKAKFNIVLVVGAVVKDGKVLIGQRSWDEVQAPGVWSLPGGKVEVQGEFNSGVIEKALKREIMEEMGVKVEDEIVYIRSGSFVRVDGAPVVVLLFACKWKSGEPKPLEDTIEVAWVGKKDLDKYEWAAGIKEAVKLVLERSKAR